MESNNYICGGQTITYAKGYIALPLELGELPSNISVEGVELIKKSSFHISLLCVKDLLEKYGDIEDKILESFCASTKDHVISFERFNDELRFAQHDERKSLVALCEVSNLKELFAHLRKDLDIDIPDQPTHVTLYTLQLNAGIGLNSPADMEEKSMTVNVEIPTLAVITR